MLPIQTTKSTVYYRNYNFLEPPDEYHTINEPEYKKGKKGNNWYLVDPRNGRPLRSSKKVDKKEVIEIGFMDFVKRDKKQRETDWNPVITTSLRTKSMERAGIQSNIEPINKTWYNKFPKEISEITAKLYHEIPTPITIDNRPLPNKCIIVNISMKRDMQQCDQHPDGCGFEVKMEDLVYIDGRDNHFVCKLYYIGAYRVRYGDKQSCKIGVVKCQYDCVKYFQHRYCVIQSVHHITKDKDDTKCEKRKKMDSIVDRCREIASAVFLSWFRFEFMF